MLGSIKGKLIKSSFAFPAFELVAFFQWLRIVTSFTSNSKYRTVYVISPYKTGTVFICRTYDSKLAGHQSFQHMTLKLMNRNFDHYFHRRRHYLDLVLECSGFWAGYLDEILTDPQARKYDYICVLRYPSSWISSVISYWLLCDYLKYDSINEHFWKKRVGVDLRNFGDRTVEDQEQIIGTLFNWYMDFTIKTKKLSNITYLRLEELADKMHVIDQLTGMQAQIKKTTKNRNKNKGFDYKNEAFDRAYEELIADFTIS